MKNTFILLPIVVLMCIVGVHQAKAETVLRVGESVSVAADQRVEDDLYGMGGIVTMSGSVAGDMYAVGGSITVNGPIEADLSAAGGSLQIHGPISDDVRIFGGDITIADSVSGDVFVIGGSLTILSSAQVEGDVFFYGGEAEINGAVGGSIMGTAERFRIDAPVGENIDVTSSRPLTLGERASVRGDVSYTSFGEMVRSQNAVVEGSVMRSEPDRERGSSGFTSVVTGFVIHLFALLVVYLACKDMLVSLTHQLQRDLGRNGLIGIGFIVLAPILAILLLITVLGIYLGLISLFLFLSLLFASYVLSGALVGAFASRFVVKRSEVTLPWMAAGVAIMQLLLLIPLIGPLAVFAVCAVVLGGIVVRIYRVVRP